MAIDVLLAGVDKVPRSWSELGRTKAAGIFTAGSAGYVAQCYAKLGGRTAIVARIGDDQAGQIILDGFRQSQVSTRYLIVDNYARTEVSTVLVYNNGNKTSIISEVPPLDSRLLDLRFLNETKALHIGGYLLIPSLWGNNIRGILRRASRADVIVSLDPQMSATRQWSKAFRGICEQLHVLLVDEVEAIRISGKRNLLNAIEHLHRNGVQIVAVKAGRKGCVVSEGGKLCTVKALKAKVVSTIGAGDAFDAAFMYGVLKKWHLEKVAQFSNAAASISTTQLGCATAIPHARRVKRLADDYYRSRRD